MSRLTLLLLALVVLAAASSCPAKQGYPSGNITSGSVPRPEGDREFRIYVPTSYDNTKPMPLMFSFHGLGDSCDNFVTATGLNNYADSRGYILVAPCGTNGLMGTAWNSGTCCGFGDNTHPDDVQFTRDMYNHFKSTLCIDTDRVYSTGFSNGAMMSETLACNASDIFRAVVSVSGITELRPGNSDGLRLCDQGYAAGSRNTGVLNIHGDLDFLVPWTGNMILGFPTVPQNMDAWAKRAGCSLSQMNTTFTKGAFTGYSYGSCGTAHGRSVELVKNEGGGHTWPVTDDFDATAYAVAFLLDRN